MSTNLTVVVAASRNGGIGNKNTLPWRLKGDMSFFKQLTTNTAQPNTVNAVIMGRKTWDSIPNNFKPLSGRLNIVLSRNPNFKSSSLPPSVQTYSSLTQALENLADPVRQPQAISSLFVIGGSSIYKECLPLANRIFLTRVLSPPNLQCDTFVEELAENTTGNTAKLDAERLQAGDEWMLQSNDRFDEVVLNELRVEGIGKGGEVRVEGELEYAFRMYERKAP